MVALKFRELYETDFRNLGELRNLVREALDTRPADAELLLLLLAVAAHCAVVTNKPAEACRLAAMMEELDSEEFCLELRVWSRQVRSGVYRGADEPAKAVAMLSEALELTGLDSDNWRWSECKTERVEAAIATGDYELAERDLADLDKRHAGSKSPPNSLAPLRVSFCAACGRIEEGLRVIEAHPFESRKRADTVRSYFSLLLRGGRLAGAATVLLKAREQISTEPFAYLMGKYVCRAEYENLCAQLALANREFETAQRHVWVGIADSETVYPEINGANLRLLAQTELAMGHAEAARRSLEATDPTESSYSCRMTWARLYLLEGNYARAAFHYRKLADKNIPELIEAELRYAHEVSASQIGKLAAFAASPTVLTKRKMDLGEADAAPTAGPKPVLVGDSPAMRGVRSAIRKLASSDATVLITGETGTGKEIVARLLHRQGRGPEKPFVPVNCGALSDTLIESELFGHVKGAFTGAVRAYDGLLVTAEGGTILLDEIHLMSPRLQGALLRAIELREVRPMGSTEFRQFNARIIAASNVSLEAAVEGGRFRADLYFRIHRLHIDIPPLRERPDDIPLLVEHFLRDFYGEFEVAVEKELMTALARQPWPGNVRELRNHVERLVLMAGESRVLGRNLLESWQNAKRVAGSTRVDVVPAPGARSEPGFADVGLGPRHTLSRRRRLKALFNEYGSLTRAEAVKMLGCSNATATRDLKALEADGYVRRVHTSAHLRTSYFERCKQDG